MAAVDRGSVGDGGMTMVNPAALVLPLPFFPSNEHLWSLDARLCAQREGTWQETRHSESRGDRIIIQSRHNCTILNCDPYCEGGPRGSWREYV